jgi:two-component system chemotaxis response regulator CheY
MASITPETPILIVDDALTARVTLRNQLEKAGFKSVVDAASVAAAWSILERPDCQIGLILSDHNMPEETGLSFLIRVRSDARFKNLPFVMITAEGEHSSMLAAIKAGVSQYLVKPVQTDLLLRKISALS